MNKEELKEYIDLMDDEQVELLGNLINLANDWSWEAKVKVCGLTQEQWRKIDTAYPCDYAKSIREIYPDFDKGHNVFDYNDSIAFGKMVNLNNLFVDNLLNNLKLRPEIKG